MYMYILPMKSLKLNLFLLLSVLLFSAKSLSSVPVDYQISNDFNRLICQSITLCNIIIKLNIIPQT